MALPPNPRKSPNRATFSNPKPTAEDLEWEESVLVEMAKSEMTYRKKLAELEAQIERRFEELLKSESPVVSKRLTAKIHQLQKEVIACRKCLTKLQS